MLGEQIQFETSTYYRLGKTHVEYMEYYNATLARLTLGRFTAKFEVGGDCYLRYGNTVVHSMHGKPTWAPQVVEAVRRKDVKVIYTRKNSFYIRLYDGTKLLDNLPQKMFELPAPFDIKVLMLEAIRVHILQKHSVHKAPLWLTEAEKNYIDAIRNHSALTVQLQSTRQFELTEERLSRQMEQEDGLVNVLSHFQTGRYLDNYKRIWFSLEFETVGNAHQLVKKEFAEVLRLHQT